MASIHWKIIFITSCLCWSSCLSQNSEENLLAFVKEAVERIKDMAEKVEDLRERLDGLNESQMAVHGKVEEMDRRFTTKFEDLRETLDGINERDLQRDTWNNPCREDHITELKTNFSTELQKIERSIERRSSVEQQSSNLTMVLTKDECSEGSHSCSPLAVCEDAIVSYRCICLPGTTGDGFTCEDVDECASDENRCHNHAECSNFIGNYTCACNPGFDGDGFNCREVPPCVHPSFTIPGIMGCVTAVKEKKTWIDASRYCSQLPSGGRLLQGWDSIAQSELISNYVNKALDITWDGVWVGVYMRRWTEEKTDVPSVLFINRDTPTNLKDLPDVYLSTLHNRIFETSSVISSLYFVCQTTSPSSSSSSSLSST